MSDFKSKDLTDLLLADAEDLMREICEANQRAGGSYAFTSQQFLKRAAQRQQAAYVELLERCRIHFPDYIFNKAHECIGAALSWRASKAGYEQIKGQTTETDIFDNPTRLVKYQMSKDRLP